MKSKLIITLLVTFFIGIGKAQTTAEAYLALLPPVPGKPCEISTDDYKSFTNKMEALIRKIETEIDKREYALNSLVEKKQKKDAAEKRKKLDMTEEDIENLEKDLENLEKMSQAEIMEMMSQPERIEKSKDKKSMISKEAMDKRMKEFEKAQKNFQSGEDFEKKFDRRYNDLIKNYESDEKNYDKEYEAFAISLRPINDGEGSTPADHAKMRQLREKGIKLGKKLCSDYTTLYESILEEYRSDIEREIPNLRYLEEIGMRDEGLENKDIAPLKAVFTFFSHYIFLADYFFNPDEGMPNWRYPR